MGVGLSNIVKEDKLKEVQSTTLKNIASIAMKTAGPLGSYAQILHDDRLNEYSKDGHKVISNIIYYNPLERAILKELLELTTHIVKTVGDGTTSAVVLSSLIFDSLRDYQQKHNVPTFRFIETFKVAVNNIKSEIKSCGKDVDMDDIYKICMISTNGNEDISRNILKIYQDFGKNVMIDVGISNTTENLTKAYDGLTLQRGYPSPAYINTKDGRSVIKNPKIYCFRDPIDTMEMISFLEKIIFENIVSKLESKSLDFVPTVIMAPNISRDVSTTLEDIESLMYGYDNVGRCMDKPPIMIITGINKDIDSYTDLMRLCGCPTINKYINPDVQRKDIEEGKAPTIDTITEWCGSCELISTDNMTSKFINPKLMFSKEVNDDGSRKTSDIFNGMISFLEAELDLAVKNSEDLNIIGNLRRRLNCLRTNLVEYFIGGVTVADRDSVRDLVEDAVLNCRSACSNGVGRGANFEALMASKKLGLASEDGLLRDIYKLIFDTYSQLLKNLYSTYTGDENEVENLFNQSMLFAQPMNLRNGEIDGTVLSSIDSDIVILDAISKIITVMFTSNQALITNPQQNVYIDKDDI